MAFIDQYLNLNIYFLS
jgi:hypothetical protein